MTHCSVRWLALFLIVAVFGCSGKEPDATGNTEEGPAEIVIAGSTWYGHIPAIYGIESGIFEKHGFTVKFAMTSQSSERVAAMASGNVHFASVGQVSMLSFLANGHDSFYWVGNQDIAPGFEGLVGGKTVNSWEDLKGKKIGFPWNSSVDITVRDLLKQHGLSSDDVELVKIDTSSVVSSVDSGAIDAGAVWEPHFSKLQALEGATLLGLDTDTAIYKQFKTMTGPDVLLISREWADNHPAEAQKFMTAYWESVAAVKADLKKTLDLIYKKYFTSQTREQLEANLAKYQWLTAEDQATVMTDDGLFAQTEAVVEMLVNDMKSISDAPDFRKAVRRDLIPPFGTQ